MEDLKQIQEFFSKPLNEVSGNIDLEDFAKVVKAVEQTGHPVTVLLTPMFGKNEIELVIGMDAPDPIGDSMFDIMQDLGYKRGDFSIVGDTSTLSRREYSQIRRVNGGHRDYQRWEESVNEAYIVTYAKNKGEKPASAAYKLRGSALAFMRDLEKDGYITMLTQKPVDGVDESVNEGAVEIMDAFNDVMDLVKKHSRNLSDDDSYALALKLKAWFNKNILDEAKVEVDDKTEFKLDLKHLLDKHVVEQGYSLTNEATKDEENEFHKELDKLVHKTFGASSDEKKEMEENMLSLDDEAKAYYLEKLKKGEIDTLPEDPKAAFLNQMTKDQIDHDKETLRRERGLEEKAAYIAETIKLGQQLNEELCEKGKRYIAARQAAGEKSSAYLSGRAVRVCKGQIEWPKKGKKKK